MVKIVGIDPGMKGALAYIDTEGRYSVFDMPIKPGHHKSDMVDTEMVKDIIESSWGKIDFVIIERPIWLKVNGSTQATNTWFNYGRLTAAFPDWGEVVPSAWKKEMGLSKNKRDSREMAMSLFPNVAHQLTRARDDGRAEALLIAEWFRRSLPELKEDEQP